MGKVKPAWIMLSVCEREHGWASRGIGRRRYRFIVERQFQFQFNRLSNNEEKKEARGAEDVGFLKHVSGPVAFFSRATNEEKGESGFNVIQRQACITTENRSGLHKYAGRFRPCYLTITKNLSPFP